MTTNNKKKQKFNNQQQHKKGIDIKETQSVKDTSNPVDNIDREMTGGVDVVEVTTTEHDDNFDPSKTEYLMNSEAARIRKENKNVRFFRMLNDQFIVYKVITRAEQHLMTNLSFEQQAEFDAITDYEERMQKLEDLRSDNILRYFVLFPRPERIEYCKETFGGFIDTVVNEILVNSGYEKNTVSNPL